MNKERDLGVTSIIIFFFTVNSSLLLCCQNLKANWKRSKKNTTSRNRTITVDTNRQRKKGTVTSDTKALTKTYRVTIGCRTSYVLRKPEMCWQKMRQRNKTIGMMCTIHEIQSTKGNAVVVVVAAPPSAAMIVKQQIKRLK